MSISAVDIVEYREDSDAATVLRQLLGEGSTHILLRRDHVTVPQPALAHLLRACTAPMASTASPVPSTAAPLDVIAEVARHHRLPPPPSLLAPCLDACVIARDTLLSIPTSDLADLTSLGDALAALFVRLVNAGWRHVAAPGTALDWSGSEVRLPLPGGWSQRAVDEVAGDANEGLATHQLWARYTLRGARLIVDGACLTDSPHNGSQKLVVSVTEWLQRVRPDASVTLAVRREHVEHFRKALPGQRVDVVARDSTIEPFDIVYRPYQLIDPGEVGWVLDAGDRIVMGQLDMIAFSNPSYHPSPALFHAVRNLQRRMLRRADGVTFISAFGKRAAVAECPDLQAERLFVVSCGTKSEPPAHRTSAVPTLAGGHEFVLCLSATFWHKNRQHALRVFAQLCQAHDYRGSLVIAGPEPYYGRSTEAEQRVIEAMPADVASRITRLGQIDEETKWSLFADAQLVIYPSVVEGFGLVPFEAAAVRTPSLSYAGSGLDELLGGAPCLATSWNVAEWAAIGSDLITNERSAAAAIEAVNQAADLHTWERVAHLTWEAIDATVASARVEPVDEEGGWTARIARPEQPLAISARPIHFANRVVAFVERRLRRS